MFRSLLYNNFIKKLQFFYNFKTLRKRKNNARLCTKYRETNSQWSMWPDNFKFIKPSTNKWTFFLFCRKKMYYLTLYCQYFSRTESSWHHDKFFRVLYWSFWVFQDFGTDCMLRSLSVWLTCSKWILVFI